MAWLLVLFAGATTLALLAGSRGAVLSGAFAPVALLLGVPLALYGTLTVRVDRDALHVSFGVGFITRRIDLSQVRGWRAVRARLRNGIGVRFIRGGTLYNVTPGPAVELLLAGNRVVWVGTPEPARLMAALARVRQAEVPDYPAVVATVRRHPWRPIVLIAAAVALVVIGWHAWRTSLQPEVTVSSAAIIIDAAPYRERIPIALLTSVSLEDSFPNVRRGFDALPFRKALRGRFLLEGTGSALIFADRDRPPFLHLRTAANDAIIGFRDPARTRALYEEVLRARQRR